MDLYTLSDRLSERPTTRRSTVHIDKKRGEWPVRVNNNNKHTQKNNDVMRRAYASTKKAMFEATMVPFIRKMHKHGVDTMRVEFGVPHGEKFDNKRLRLETMRRMRNRLGNARIFLGNESLFYHK